jgi:precorrin-2 dehydrogenase/sirohydrochlorin ferrochelatase
MRYYPVNLDLNNRRCLVVGGGRVGTRKVKTLLQCGALVKVVSLSCTDTLQALVKKKAVTFQSRSYHPSDLDHVFMVFAATTDAVLNQRIAGDARRLKVLCNIADAPANSDFVVPSTFRRGDLTIAVSTAGKSPALARRIRLTLEDQWGDEYELLVDILGRIRCVLLEEGHAPDAHKAVFETLLNADLPEMLKKGEWDAVQTLLTKVLGAHFHPENILPRRIIAARVGGKRSLQQQT